MCTDALAAAHAPHSPVAPSGLAKIRSDEQGATAVEFAIICVPFVTMLLGIMSVCLYFFTVLEMENAVWQASREMRTGEFQTYGGRYVSVKPVDPANPTAAELTAWKQAFTTSICEKTRDATSCAAKIRVIVTKLTNFSAADMNNGTRCKDPANGGNLITQTEALSRFDVGGADQIVLITACYSWDFGGQLPFFKIGNMPDGSFLVQGSYAFRTEPYS